MSKISKVKEIEIEKIPFAKFDILTTKRKRK